MVPSDVTDQGNGVLLDAELYGLTQLLLEHARGLLNLLFVGLEVRLNILLHHLSVQRLEILGRVKLTENYLVVHASERFLVFGCLVFQEDVLGRELSLVRLLAGVKVLKIRDLGFQALNSLVGKLLLPVGLSPYFLILWIFYLI